jgi:transcriptional regulator with XRE-family HTH domain
MGRAELALADLGSVGPASGVIDPDDRAGLLRVVADLRAARERQGITQQSVADALAVSAQAVGGWEAKRNPNPLVLTVQRYARAVNHRVAFEISGIVIDRADPGLALLADMAANPDPVKADCAARSLVLTTLVAERERRGWFRRHVAERMGATANNIHQVESERDEPRLSTFMRYARALGAALDVVIVPGDE